MRYLTLAALVLFAVPLQGQEERVGDLYFVADADEMTDEDRSFVLVPSEDEDYVLGWKCFGPNVLAFLVVNDAMDKMRLISFGDEKPKVRFRFGDEPASETRTWTPHSGDPGTLQASSTVSGELVRGARSAREVVVRLWNADGEHVGTRAFSMMGATRAFSRLDCISS